MSEITIGRAYYLLKEGKEIICTDKVSNKIYKLIKTNYNSNIIEVLDEGKIINIDSSSVCLALAKSTKVRKKSNHIYLLEDINYVKIGKSNNPKKRCLEVKVGNPSVKLVTSYESEDADTEETDLHEKFKEFSVGGEWFFKDISIFKFFGAKSLFPPVIKVIDLELSEKLWDYIDNNKVSIYKLVHAVRLNGICDVWYKNSTVFDISNNSYLYYKNEQELLSIVDTILKNNVGKQSVKSTKKGKISYQQYLNNKRQ
jgi:hypothetical protein